MLWTILEKREKENNKVNKVENENILFIVGRVGRLVRCTHYTLVCDGKKGGGVCKTGSRDFGVMSRFDLD
jgi:hypothetical protein